MSTFFCDLFLVEDSSEINGIHELYKVENGKAVIDYNNLLSRSEIKFLIICDKLYLELFGVHVPRPVACMFKQYNNLDQEDLINTLLTYVIKTSFYRYIINENLIKNYQVKLRQELNINSLPYCKDALSQWIVRGSATGTHNESLFKSFIKMSDMTFNVANSSGQNKMSSFIYTCPKVIEDNLLLCRREYDNRTTMNLYDIAMQRYLYNLPCVLFAQDLDNITKETYLNMIGSLENSKIVLLQSTPFEPLCDHITFNYSNIEDLQTIPYKLLNKLYIVGKFEKVMLQHFMLCPRPVWFTDYYQSGTSLTQIVSNDSPCCEIIENNDALSLPGIDIFPTISAALLKVFLKPTSNTCKMVYRHIAMMFKKELRNIQERLKLLTDMNLEKGKNGGYMMKNKIGKFKQNCLLLIDNRENGLSLLAVIISLLYLDPTLWDVVIVTSTKSCSYYQNNLPFARVIVIPQLDYVHFDVEVYNTVCKSSNLWESLQGYNKCLTIQDDGFLVKAGIEQSIIFNYDYVGAPWITCKSNEEVRHLTNMVGNGGFSLRSVNACRTITSEEGLKNLLFNNNVQPIQEDVYFSHMMTKQGYQVAPVSVAKTFSIEQVYVKDSFGFHKFWMYHDEQYVKEWLENNLSLGHSKK
jgi:hypothetical protein